MTEREAELQAVRLQKVEVLGKPIELADYDPAWPERYEREAAKIRAAANKAAADGSVTKEEAKRVRELSREMRKEMKGKRSRKAK